MGLFAHVVLEGRRTWFTELVESFNTCSHAKSHLGNDYAEVNNDLVAHDLYQKALTQVKTLLRPNWRAAGMGRKLLDTYQSHSEDTFVVVGQDSLVVNTFKYLNG